MLATILDVPKSTADDADSTYNLYTAAWGKWHLWEHCWYTWITYLLLTIKSFLTLMCLVSIFINDSVYALVFKAICLYNVYLDSVPALTCSGFRWISWSQYSERLDVLGSYNCANLECTINEFWRYTGRLRWSESRVAVGYYSQAELVMHLKPWLSKFESILSSLNWTSLEMHLKVMIMEMWRTCLSDHGDSLGGYKYWN